MRKRSWRSLSGLGVLALLLSACGGAAPGGSSTTTQAPPPAKPQVVRIAVASPSYTPWAPLYLAQKKGFFEKYGVTVDVSPYNGGGPMQQALESGSADVIHFFGVSVALAISKGVKEHIVAAYEPYADGWYILVKDGSPIRQLSDLANKKIGISGTGSATDMYARWALKKGGVEGQIIPLGDGRIASLIAGQVDAAIASPPNGFLPEKKGLRALVDLGKVMNPVLQDTVVASDAFIASHPDAIRGYLKGLFEGVAYMKAHRDESLLFMVEYTKQTREVEEKEFDAEILRLSDDGAFKPEWFEEALQLGAGAGLKGLPPASSLYVTQFVPVKY